MTPTTCHQFLYRQFATLFSYPDEVAPQTADACAEQLRELDSAAAAPMARFAALLAAQPPARLEELFTATFDLQPVCHPYVGYQLCGESQQRAMLLMRLQQLYRQHGFIGDSELPDHLATLLRFVGSVADRECGMEIIHDGLLPALDKMAAGLEGEKQPYGELIKAVQSFLSETVAAGTGPVTAASRRS
jgi:nitrate reductase molybdenum cofactor assembly chaperone NarJ/NarW